ncbi:Wzz/FepE/Etk N-terminal domain-containing protein [Tenacibaculum finnmarkense]|uniref:Wzz/FepE/Etk N-terminal domain-containing protein n=1 Tax=Tenacibaculum finnmarkense TaxID=2781243 RepID=UPI00187B49FE|nr:Wzz/FepE/Etk N-terminal domain-containing protein [Tenacibaculum finnmarkense]MBE7660893.1 capsule biosynthesis protein [Tenacibaculum finnmarkense genomovar finnmarkense]MCG8252517.1 capsule biosynthesis protein [Tenacibaculum finnmarkense genomovar finnmarkense]MCG8815945.1 capsule biosynthesis protein [Tenacibaculum finnmarkense]MCG8820964.1 capsule biosynthesis protein [Tenacibaculum finnmarkense]
MENNNRYNNTEDEIDLVALFRTLKKGKKTIIRFTVVFALIGLFIAVFTAKEYTASTTLVPQTSSSKPGGALGGLAAMAGINLGSGGSTESISPHLYPKITQSILFKKELLNVPLKFSYLEKEVTYQEYYLKYQKTNVLSFIKQYTIGLPAKFIGLFKSKKEVIVKEVAKDAIYRVSLEEIALFKSLGNQLSLDINPKEGYVKIAFSMPEALPAAQMTKKVKELLQKSITDFKVQKTKEEYIFIEERYKELKKDFENKQATLASFRDRNQGLITSRSKSRIESLQSEYNLAATIYYELAKQLETQKIKLKENTPVFTVLEPVSVPVIKSKPRRGMIFIIWLFLGIIAGMGFVFGKDWLKKLKDK